MYDACSVIFLERYLKQQNIITAKDTPTFIRRYYT